MVEERFTIIWNNSEIGVKEHKSGDVIVLTHRDLNSEQFVAQIVTFLNEQNDAIEKLITKEKYWEQKAIQRINYLEEENEKLKKDIQDLKTGTYINAKNNIAELQKEIEHLREYNNKLLKKPLLTDILPNAIEIMAANTELEKENDKLKSDRVRFEEETRLEVTRVMDKIFELIDKKIEFYKHKPVSAPISNPANPKYDDDVDRLARLSELEDLKETLKELGDD